MTSDLIQELYVGYFGRAGDPAGMSYWTTAELTQSITQMSQSFSVQLETLALYPALNTPQTLKSNTTAQAGFLDAIYQNLFGHAPDANGLAYWEGQLSAGFSPGLMIAAIIGGALGLDAVVMNAKAAVAQSYTTAVAQATNPPVTWSATGDTARSRAILSGVTSATATGAAAMIAAAIVVDQGAGPSTSGPGTSGPSFPAGVTYTLTTGTDTFTGGAGDDTFNSADVAFAPTWTANDAIAGGGGTNTFNVTRLTAIAGAPSGATVVNIQIANIVDGSSVTLDTTGWTGLTASHVTDVGATNLTAAITSAVTLTDTSLGANAVAVSGGAVITATVSGVTSSGSVAIGDSTTSGAITATVNDVNTTDVTGSPITTNGGTTVNVTQNITAGISGTGTAVTAAGGVITVNGGAATSSVTASQTAAIAAVAGVNVAVDITETATLAFDAFGLSNGELVTIGGLTYQASASTSQAQLSAAFAGLSAGATTGAGTGTGSYSGTLIGWSTGADVANVVTFTSTTPNANVADLGTGGAIGVIGGIVEQQGQAASAGTTAVNGIQDGAVNIADANAGSLTVPATITSVTLNNYGNSTISSNALTNLSLAGLGGLLNLTSGLTTNTVLTLHLTVNGLQNAPGGSDSISDTSNHYTTVAITTTGADSFIGHINDSVATALTVTGTNILTLQSTSFLPELQSIIVSGSAGLNTNVSGIAAITDVNASASSGNNTITLNAAQTTFEGGSGVNTVTESAVATKVINGGSGSANVLNFEGLGGSLLSASTQSKLLDFSTLEATQSEGTFDLAYLTGITAVQVGLEAFGVSFHNAAAGTTLAILADPTYSVSFQLATVISSSALTLSLGTAQTAGFTVTGGASIGLIPTVNLVSNGTGTGTNGLALTDSAVTVLNVSGAESLTLTGLTANGLTNLTDTQAAGTTFTLTTASASTNGAVVNDGNANFVFTGAAGVGHVDSITAGNGDNTLIDAAGNDSINLGNGTNVVTLAGSGASSVIVGTGANNVVLGGGANSVTLGAHGAGTADNVSVTAAVAGAIVPTAVISGLNSVGLDTITFQSDGATSFTDYTPTQINGFATALSAPGSTASLAGNISDILLGGGGGNLADRGIAAFQFGGGTYLVEQALGQGTAFGTGDTLVQMAGSPVFNSTSVSLGVLHFLT
jgi:S-layer protein